MDAPSGVYTEKKLAFYETAYKENVISKPQEINLTVTAAHLYGLAFICDQVGTKESDPEYTRFTCSLEEITKVYINTNNKNSPIYIQCDDTSKATMNRRRIILPSFGVKNNEIVQSIVDAKAEFDIKANKLKEIEYNQKKKAIESQNSKNYDRARKSMDDEFESMTADFNKSISNSKKAAAQPKAEPAEMVFAETKPAVPKSDFSSDAIVADMLGIDEILSEISSSAITSHAKEFEFEVLEFESDELEFESIPEEIHQKAPAEIEELVVPVIDEEYEEIPAVTAQTKHNTEIEEVDTEKIIQQKLAEKKKKTEAAVPKTEETIIAEPFKKEIPVEEPVIDVTPVIAPVAEPIAEPAPKPEAAPIKVIEPVASTTAAVTLTLEEFETAVKKLKIMLDTGAITENEFAIEKKKLLSTLY